MQFRAARYRVALGAVWMIAASVAAAGAQAGAGDEEAEGSLLTAELSGRLSAESRTFPATGAFPGQRSLAAGFVVEPTVYVEAVSGASFTLAPFFRYDHSDPRRTHFDLREAYLLLFGDAGDGGWEARVGVGQVFWGATESQRLVDIVNQVDFVEHLNGEAKLGQPMAHLTWFGDWGTLEVLGTSYHRAAHFPRPPRAVTAAASHRPRARSVRKFRQAVASRFRVAIQPQPRVSRPGCQRIRRHQPGALPVAGRRRRRRARTASVLPPDPPIRSGCSVDARLLAAEGRGDSARGRSQSHRPGTGLLRCRARRRVSVLRGCRFRHRRHSAGEWSYDSRGPTATPTRSPNTLENDIFFATRFAFNDVQSSELTTSVVADARRATRALALEFGRRITNEWSLRAEAVALLSVDQSDLHYEMRRDSFIDMSLTYNF